MDLALLTKFEQAWTGFVSFGIVVTLYALYQAWLDYLDVRNDTEFLREQISAKGELRRELFRLCIQISLVVACVVSLHLLSKFKEDISIRGEQLIPTGCFTLMEILIVANTIFDLFTRYQAVGAYRKLKRRDQTSLSPENDWTEDAE